MSAFSTPQLIGGGKVLMICNLIYLQGLSNFDFPFAAVRSRVTLLVAVGSLGHLQPAIKWFDSSSAKDRIAKRRCLALIVEQRGIGAFLDGNNVLEQQACAGCGPFGRFRHPLERAT